MVEMSYPFADRAAEDERLIVQGRFFDPLTRRLLREAGLAPGMRVLDLGSGSGNVARLAAEFVGPDGAVVGIEKDPAAIELADRHTDASNIEYREGDAQTLDGVEDGFDAVVGRLILMYLPDPAAALRRAATRLRPGGLICMHEIDLDYVWTSPRTPLWDRAQRWLLETMEKAGVETRMGLALYAAFRAAGLPEPRLLVEAYAAGESDAPTLAKGYANLVSGPVPLMERMGVTTRAEVDPPTLADRFLREILDHDGYIMTPPFTGAWTTLPTT
jgi:SAM-dependent methyltransferase